MDLRGFQQYQPGTSRYNNRIPEEEWDRHKATLKDLHDKKLTRQQILEIISPQFGEVKPTYGQLCTKFEKWGFLVYTKPGKPKKDAVEKKKPQPNVSNVVENQEVQSPAAFSTEGSDATILPNFATFTIGDQATPKSIYSIPQTPENRPVWPDTSPRADFYNNTTSQGLHAPAQTEGEADVGYHEDNRSLPRSSHEAQRHPSTPATQQTNIHSRNTSSLGENTPIAEQPTRQPSRPPRQGTYNLGSLDQEDFETLPARTRNADESLEAVMRYLTSLGQTPSRGSNINTMLSLAAYLFATRSYSPAFRLYRKVYDIMVLDLDCNDVSRVGALMKCAQSAVEQPDLVYMQKELHRVLKGDFGDSSLSGFVARLLLSIETQISEGFNLSQVSGVVTTPIMKNTTHLMTIGCGSSYPGTSRIYWRLKLLSHTPFHSGCARLFRLLSELLSWAWAAMTLFALPDPTIKVAGCLCKDGLYFDFVRMITTMLLQAATGFDILDFIKIQTIRQTTKCTCVMCSDLEATFNLCPIETFTAIAFLTVDRCRLDWTSCPPGGRHQELSPRTILQEQLRPTIVSLLDQVAANIPTNIQSPANIHTSDLYDDFLSCIWSTFETHDLPLKKARFDASFEKIDALIARITGEHVPGSEHGSNGINADINGHQPVFDYPYPFTRPASRLANGRIGEQIEAAVKRNRSNASSLRPSNSNASERSMIRIRKKLKLRTSQDILNSMSSYSSLSSRNSMNRFSYVTGLPDLEPVLDQEEPQNVPPDMTPEDFARYQKVESWQIRPPSAIPPRLSYRESGRR